jgi:CheY-like chemotaxis protein
MGGRIWLESELGSGSTFSFTFPLKPEEPAEIEDAVDTRSLIMVVDDNEDIAALLKRQLEEVGYAVMAVSNGNEVLEAARQYQPSLITLDILLDKVDGFEVLAQLKADPETRNIPVVIASVLPDMQSKGLSLGAADYLVKPFEEDQVLETVQSLLETVDTRATNGQRHFTKILVVDDDKDIVAWLKKALTNNDFKVSGAYNGKEALQLARANQPDLILLDLKMPDMDGFEVIEQLKDDELTANIPVIVITGSSIDKKRDKIKMVGLDAKHLLTKPFSFEQLVSEIRRLEESESAKNTRIKI